MLNQDINHSLLHQLYIVEEKPLREVRKQILLVGIQKKEQ